MWKTIHLLATPLWLESSMCGATTTVSPGHRRASSGAAEPVEVCCSTGTIHKSVGSNRQNRHFWINMHIQEKKIQDDEDKDKLSKLSKLTKLPPQIKQFNISKDLHTWPSHLWLRVYTWPLQRSIHLIREVARRRSSWFRRVSST